MGKKKEAPDYATTTTSSGGLFGSSTSGKTGTTYTPEDWQKQLGNTASTGLNTTLNNMLSNDYANDANFQAYQNQLNKSMAQNYDSSVLSQLANRGLMRSSGLQSATNSFADTLANNTMNLYDSYYNRQANNLSNLLNTENALYNWMVGLNNNAASDSNNVSNYNFRQWQANSNLNPSMWDRLSNMGTGAIQGAQAGSAGGPWGALAGGIAGGVSGAMSSQKNYSAK